MTFAELVALMVLGTGAPDSVAGVVRHSSPEDGEWTHRVWRRGDLERRESPDGRVLTVTGVDHLWLRADDDERMTAYPRATSHFARAAPIGGLEPGGERPTFARWDGTDFTRATGPVTPTTFLGRDGWLVELAPPRHKPYPIQVTVDAATGLVLRDANRDFGMVTEFTEVDIGADLSDDLFVWDGPARTHEERESERDAERAAELAWLDARGLVLEVPVRPALNLNQHDDGTGAFEVHFHAGFRGLLVRRPVGAGGPSEFEGRFAREYRWSDSRWDWALGTSDPIADEQLALLKVQLGKST